MSYTSITNDLELAESTNWPLVAAARGYAVLDDSFHELAIEPVLAWRVGARVVLPVTRVGFKPSEAWVVYPNGSVRHHGLPAPGDVPDFPSVEEWQRARAADRAAQSRIVADIVANLTPLERSIG